MKSLTKIVSISISETNIWVIWLFQCFILLVLIEGKYSFFCFFFTTGLVTVLIYVWENWNNFKNSQVLAPVSKIKLQHVIYTDLILSANTNQQIYFIDEHEDLTLKRLGGHFDLPVVFRKMCFQKRGWSPAFLWLLNHRKSCLSWKFHGNSSSRSEDMKIFSFSINYFHQFPCDKETNNISI